MNCCCLLILLLLFGGNNCGTSCGNWNGNRRNGDNRRNDNNRRNDDCHYHDDQIPTPLPTPCGCNDDMMQPRGFAGFSNVGTCGCEEKDD